ncbi:putative HTH-type transcriptional regulator YdfL [Podospora australis]|uniref:HTH-type transcriptional regulator YdfL n=1 Tax=Podospora australis TaxID=1536484 RepID=A0AAN7AF42_9PEZI|nr:putative HTH-type transcriptional regulator YdfL [Podospora australis]
MTPPVEDVSIPPPLPISCSSPCINDHLLRTETPQKINTRVPSTSTKMSSILSCLCGESPDDFQCGYTPTPGTVGIITEKQPLPIAPPSTTGAFIPRRIFPNDNANDKTDKVVEHLISILLTAPGPLPSSHLTTSLKSTAGLHAQDWSTWLAEKLLHALEQTLSESDKSTWGEALTEAYNDAVELAEEMFWELVQYVKEHPLEIAATVLLSLFAFGVLVRLMPWVLELLGFAELGPVEGSFAAWWQRCYGGYVPKGALFSFFQRLGMVWGKA